MTAGGVGGHYLVFDAGDQAREIGNALNTTTGWQSKGLGFRPVTLDGVLATPVLRASNAQVGVGSIAEIMSPFFPVKNYATRRRVEFQLQK